MSPQSPFGETKRKYSKSGCKECKRRKIKCDEGKPICWHCKRLEKSCVYFPPKIPKSKSKTIRTQAAVSTSIDQHGDHNHLAISDKNEPLTHHIQQLENNHKQSSVSNSNILPPIYRTFHETCPHPNNQNLSRYLPQQYQPIKLPVISSTLVNSTSPAPLNQSFLRGAGVLTTSNNIAASDHSFDASRIPDSNTQPSTLTHTSPVTSEIVPGRNNYDQLGMELSIADVADFDPTTTANCLVHSLNDILTHKLDEVKSFDINDSSMSPIMHMLEQFDHPCKEEGEDMKFSEFGIFPVSVDYFQFTGVHRTYLELFSSKFAKLISPYTPTPDSNPAGNIILSFAMDNNYLLAAVMACGALEAHMESNDPEDKNSYCSYLSSCMQLLSTVLSDEDKLTESIEPMILTVLLLTSYNAVSKLQKWRPHLLAAKELLTKYAPSNENLRLYKKNSYVMAFCRAWYFGMESVASLTVPLGGTLEKDEEFDNMIFDLPNLEIYLRRLGLCRKDGYNLLYGYTTGLAVAVQKLVKYMKKSRRAFMRRSCQPDIKVSDISDLIAALHKEGQFCIASRTGIISKDHFLHPENTLPAPDDFEPISSEAIMKVELDNGEVEYICWYDLSHHSFVKVASLLISAMICQLPKGHFIVQNLVRDALKDMLFLRTSKRVISYALLYLLVPVYLIGLNCIEPEHREMVLKYYELVSEFGNTTPDYSIQKLKKKWEKYDSREHRIIMEFDDFDEKELGTDIISY